MRPAAATSLVGLLVLVACAPSGGAVSEETGEAPAGAVLTAVPEHPAPTARYLIYLHGAIIETQGRRPTHPEYGVYEYDQILDALAARGFQVISEARPAGTKVPAYAEKVAGQVRALVEAGVPADHIAVAGHSKGAMITLGASSLLDLPGVRYVVMAGCFRGGSPIRGIHLSGHILSIYDESDRLAGSCDTVFAATPPARKRRKRSSSTPASATARSTDPMNEWLDPLTAWLGPSGLR